MIKFIRLLWEKLFGKSSEHLDGSNLFVNEYTSMAQFLTLPQLYKVVPMVRMPFRYSEFSGFFSNGFHLQSCRVSIVALLDEYYNDATMFGRLNFIKTRMPYIKFIELFNELPQCVYGGDQIGSLQQLLELTNKFSDWVHTNMPTVKVITMAPYNSLDERAFPAWDGLTNTRILKDLILYTTADIAAIHLYGESLSKQMAIYTLKDNLDKWNKEATYKKKIWITETGVEGWDSHVSFYKDAIKMYRNILKPEKIFWYRQKINGRTLQDADYALEFEEGTIKGYSALYNLLKEMHVYERKEDEHIERYYTEEAYGVD